MRLNSKSSITTCCLLIFLALFFWYRNQRYDRALAIFIFTLGLYQLIEYGVRSGSNPSLAGHSLFIVLWLQCLVLAIGVYVFINDSIRSEPPAVGRQIIHTIAGWNLFLYAIIFVVGLIYSFGPMLNLETRLDPHGNLEFEMPHTWLYMVGIFVPLFLIFGYYMWTDLEIAGLILYGALSAAYVLANFPRSNFISLWNHLTIGFAFIAWFMGMFVLGAPSAVTISHREGERSSARL